METGTAADPVCQAGGRNAGHVEEKIGSVLMSLGVFLGLLGSVFTVMSRLGNGGGAGLDFNKLMGPFLLSVGAVFMVISMGTFGMFSCRLRGRREQQEEEEEEEEEGGVTASDVSMAFHCAGAAYPKPPPYDSLQHPAGDAPRAAGGPVPGVHRADGPCCFYPPYPRDNVAFTADGGFLLVSGALTSPTGIGVLGEQQAKERDDGSSSTCPPPPPPPPPYEEICRRA